MSAPVEQHWDAAQYASNARYVSELGMPVVALLAPHTGERILDLGCGDGALTLTLMEMGCSVLGVDASSEMVAAARARGADARVIDAHRLPFAQEFDAVFSNAALHWMLEPACVIDGVWRALKPGGRFVGELGGYGNVANIVAALDSALVARGLKVPSPWFFPRPDDYRALLHARGFRVQSMDLFPRPTALPGDVGAWLATFAQHYAAVVRSEQRQSFIAEVVAALRGTLCDGNGKWHADYVRLRFSAYRP